MRPARPSARACASCAAALLMSTSTPTLNWGIVCTDRVRRSATARRCRDSSSSPSAPARVDQREHVLLLDAPAGAAALDGRRGRCRAPARACGRPARPASSPRRAAARRQGRPRPGAPTKREHLADRDRLARAVQHGEQRARDRGLDLERRLVGLDLEQQLAVLDDRVALAFSHCDDPQLVRSSSRAGACAPDGPSVAQLPDHGLDPLDGGDDRVLERRRRRASGRRSEATRRIGASRS